MQSLRPFRRKLLWLISAVAATVALFLWLFSEPSYDGRSLSAWLGDFPLTMDAAGNDLLPFSGDQQARIDRAAAAIKGMGVSAVPHLLRELRAKDSALGSPFYMWKDRLTKRDDHRWAFERQSAAAFALGELGPTVSNAVPELTRLYHDRTESDVVRHSAFLALQKIASETVQEADLK